MITEVKKLDRGKVELTIELSPNEYQPFLEQAAKKISNTTKIPGFRPGKASYELIKQKVGEVEIWQQALELAVQKTFLKALTERNLITVGSPKIDIIKLAPGNPIIYKATISLLPQVKLGDYSNIKIEKKPVVIKEDRIKMAMGNLQKMRAKENLVDRKTQKGDKVEINFETFLDKVPIDHGKNEKFNLVIGEGTFIPGFEEQLIGLGKGEEKKFQLKFPENYHQKNLAGRLADFKVKMNAVYNLDLPHLDDEFAKSLGKFKTIKEVEEQINQNIKEEAQIKESQRLEEELIDKIIAQSKFDDIPDLLIDSETKKMMDELEHSLGHQGLKLEDYLTHLKKKREDLLLDFVPLAIKRVKSALVIRKVGEENNIKTTDLEIEEEIQKTLAAYEDGHEMEQQIKSQAYRDYIRNILTARKAIDHLKSVIIK